MALQSTLSKDEAVSKVAKKSVKWSLFGEILAKISVPLSTMVLARLLTPEIYGITTAVTIIVTFCETVTDNGFSKYLIQHDFADDIEFKKHFSISVILSLILSFIMIALVFIFRYQLSSFVGNEGYEMVLVVSSIQVPITSINSLLLASLKRNFKFKRIFIDKVLYSLVPLFVTVPLAFFGLKHWSLVLGSIATQLLQLPLLIIFSRVGLSFTKTKKSYFEVIRNSLPMIFESIIIWLCSWTSTIIAANFFDSSTVGIVKVSNSTVNSIFLIFSTAFTSVLFPTLSRLKNNKELYQESFSSIQSAALTILLPLGIGIYFYSDLVSNIFLGNQWTEAAFVIGIFSLTKPLLICFNNFTSEVFRSHGHFYSSILYQIAMLIFDLIVKFTLGRISFNWFIWTTIITDLFITVLSLLILILKYKFSVWSQIKSFVPSLVCSLLMMPIVLLGSRLNNGIYFSIAQAFICATVYFLFLSIFYSKSLENCLSYIRKK